MADQGRWERASLRPPLKSPPMQRGGGSRHWEGDVKGGIRSVAGTCRSYSGAACHGCRWRAESCGPPHALRRSRGGDGTTACAVPGPSAPSGSLLAPLHPPPPFCLTLGRPHAASRMRCAPHGRHSSRPPCLPPPPQTGGHPHAPSAVFQSLYGHHPPPPPRAPFNNSGGGGGPTNPPTPPSLGQISSPTFGQ